MVHNKKKHSNINTLILIIGSLLVIFGLLLYNLFETLKQSDIQAQFNSLSKQTQNCAENYSNVLAQIDDEINYLLANEKLEGIFNSNREEKRGTFVKINQFLKKNQGLVDTLFLVKRDSIYYQSVGENNYQIFGFSESNPNLNFARLHNSEYAKYENKIVVYKKAKQAELELLVVLNISNIIYELFADYFLGVSGEKNLYSLPEGTIDVNSSLSNTQHFKSLNPELKSKLVQDLSQGLMGKFISDGPNNTKYLVSYYPTRFHDLVYGVAFSANQDDVIASTSKNFSNLLSYFSFFFLLIVGIFLYYFYQSNSFSWQLSSVNNQLNELIDEQKLLLQNSGDFVYRHDANGVFNYISDNIRSVLGYTPEEFEKHYTTYLTDSPVNKIAINKTESLITTGKSTDPYLVEIFDKQGEIKVLEVNEKALFNTSNKLKSIIGVARDITHKKKAEEELLRSKEMLTNAQKIARVGNLQWNLKTNALYFSDQLKVIFNISNEENPTINSIIEKLNPRDKALIRQFIKEKPSVADIDVVIINPDKTIKHIRCLLESAKDDTNQVIEIKGVFQDITDRKNIELELVKAKEKAEEASIIKQQFLSVMSHEIRTPLNAVVGYSHLLKRDKLTEEQSKNVNRLLYSAENLLLLINDILDFSKMDAGKLELEHAPFNLHTVIEHVIEALKIKATEKDIDVSYTIHPTVESNLIGDSGRLNQILINLVGNALKFTEKGHVKVEVDSVGSTQNKQTVVLHVHDTGIGIESSNITKIFDSFSQAGLQITRKFGGTGLGLAITKKLVDLYEGTIKVQSEPGIGSTFSVTITFDINPNPEEPTEQQEDGFEGLEDYAGKEILIVEDNLINQMLAQQFCKVWNLNSEVAANGKIALDKIAKKTYDLVLMDLQMPEMDGYEATNNIRELNVKSTAGNQLPIIAITAESYQDVKHKIYEYQFNDYLPKPFDVKELKNKLKKYLSTPHT